MGEPKSYRIEHISDLLKVPADRRAACLAELPDWLAIAEMMPVLMGDEIPILAQSFIWNDDGEPGVRSIQINGEDGLTVGVIRRGEDHLDLDLPAAATEQEGG